MDFNLIKDDLKKSIFEYYNNFSFPLKAELLENVICNCLYKNNIEFRWNCGSHSSGCDIQINDKNIAVKSAALKNKFIIISANRTTRYKTPEEKLNFLKIVNSNITYFVLLRNEEKNIIYNSILIFKSDLLKINEFSFIKNNNDLLGQSKDDNVFCKIVASMSDQVWYFINPEYLINENTVLFSFVQEKITNKNGLIIYKNS